MQKLSSILKGPRAWLALGLVAVVVVVAVFALRPSKVQASTGLYHVTRGDFLISVVEPGTLEAVHETVIRNQVEGTARVIYIVPEGTYVKKGDLLVELDSADARDEVNEQLISVEKAQFALVQAEEQLAIQKSVVESEIRAAELKTNFAWLDLNKFLEGGRQQELTKARNEITTIQEKLAIDTEKATWSEKLYKQGFETKANLDRDMLTVKQSELGYRMATNTLWMLENFDLPKQRQTFESALHEAIQELQRVRHQGARRLAQYEADVKTQTITVELSQSRLERDRENLAHAKIIAPQDGLVVYSVSDNRFSSESLIEEGATVRNRQTLIKLPDVSQMKLIVKIHESHINMISQGQPAYVVLDSMPNERFRGHVSKVGILPDTSSRWSNPNLKVYATEILVTDKLPEDVKPGVSGSVEVLVTNLHNVISVPLQAVTTYQGGTVVYKMAGGEAQPTPVNIGLYNTKFIEITSGLEAGDNILLAPPFDSSQRDLGGSIISDGEEITLTNVITEQKAIRPIVQDGPTAESPANPGVSGNGPPDSKEGQPQPRGNRPNFEEMRKQFDKNGDGQLDDTEREAMRKAFGGFGGGRRRQGSGDAEGGVERSRGPRGERGGGGEGGENRGGRSRSEVPNG